MWCAWILTGHLVSGQWADHCSPEQPATVAMKALFILSNWRANASARSPTWLRSFSAERTVSIVGGYFHIDDDERQVGPNNRRVRGNAPHVCHITDPRCYGRSQSLSRRFVFPLFRQTYATALLYLHQQGARSPLCAPGASTHPYLDTMIRDRHWGGEEW